MTPNIRRRSHSRVSQSDSLAAASALFGAVAVAHEGEEVNPCRGRINNRSGRARRRASSPSHPAASRRATCAAKLAPTPAPLRSLAGALWLCHGCRRRGQSSAGETGPNAQVGRARADPACEIAPGRRAVARRARVSPACVARCADARARTPPRASADRCTHGQALRSATCEARSQMTHAHVLAWLRATLAGPAVEQS